MAAIQANAKMANGHGFSMHSDSEAYVVAEGGAVGEGFLVSLLKQGPAGDDYRIGHGRVLPSGAARGPTRRPPVSTAMRRMIRQHDITDSQ
jgi:hypothetical protein